MRELFLLEPESEDGGWQERALCAQTDPEAFFPEKGGSTREAKKVCLTCEVRDECLEAALFNDERFGIWGGLSERERRKLKKRASEPARPVAPCVWRRPRSSGGVPRVLGAGPRSLACRTVPSPDGSSVAVLLVSHDGARWLPGVLAGLAAQSVRPGLVTGVDTGSRDESATLLEGACHDVVRAGPAGYPEAVRLGLERIALAEHDHEWVWLLHDDSRPDDGALAALLTAAADHPRADLFGCKLREWPSLRRLLEVGVTVTGTARRETGLERGEYDQGQHDDIRRVLACNTAGLLVRRRVLADLGGLDDALPVLGSDLDLGWRAAAAGHTTLVVPPAVVFHAEATRRGQRPTAVRRWPAGIRCARSAGPRSSPCSRTAVAPRCRCGCCGSPSARCCAPSACCWSARRARRPTRCSGSRRCSPTRAGSAPLSPRGRPGRPSGQVAHLLAPFRLSFRHALDAAGDAAASVAMLASEAAERRRLARLVTRPVSRATAAVVVLSLLPARSPSGRSPVAGCRRHPRPGVRGGRCTWSRGTPSAPAPTCRPPRRSGRWPCSARPRPGFHGLRAPAGRRAAGAGGEVAAAPYRCSSGRCPPPASAWVVGLGAAADGLVPLASGAWGAGRLGTTMAAALLPWAVRAALALVSPHAETRQRAGWRAGLLLTLVVSFAPVLWWLAAALVLVAAVAGLGRSRPGCARAHGVAAGRDRAVVPLVLLLPWWLPALVRGAGAQLFLEAGRVPPPALDGLDLLSGRVGAVGAPAWTGFALLGLAALALLPAATRRAVAGCWCGPGARRRRAGALAARLDLAPTPAPAALGGLVVAGQVALVVAATLGLAGLTRAPRLPRPALVVAGIALAVLRRGRPRRRPHRRRRPHLQYRPRSARLHGRARRRGPPARLLVVRGDLDDGFTWAVDRGDGVTLGEDEVLATAAVDPADETVIEPLLASPTTTDATDGTRLRDLGVRHVLLPDPADGRLSAVLDATPGLTPTGADAGARAWQVEGDDPPASSVAGPTLPWRVALLVLQGLRAAGGARAGRADRAPRRPRQHQGREGAGMTTTPTPGPAAAAAPPPRRASPAALLLVLLPLAAVLLALLVDPDAAPTRAAAPPRTERVTTATVVCPSWGVDPARRRPPRRSPASPGSLDVAVAGADAALVDLAADRAADVESDGGPWFAATGRDALAPLLLAGRFASPAAAADCREPVFDQWFTGVGAGATHRSVLELANPDRGRAVVDVEVLGRDCPAEAPRPARSRRPRPRRRAHRPVDHAAARRRPRAPRAGRPRPGLGPPGGHLRRDWLHRAEHRLDPRARTRRPPPTACSGLPEGKGGRLLVLANPSDDEGSASVRLVTGGSTFAPEGVEEVRLPPRSVVRVDVGRVVEAALSGPPARRALAGPGGVDRAHHRRPPAARRRRPRPCRLAAGADRPGRGRCCRSARRPRPSARCPAPPAPARSPSRCGARTASRSTSSG